MYHAVDRMPPGARSPRNYVPPGDFGAQLELVASLGYQTISFTEWLEYREHGHPIPARPIILTFDDGYRSVWEHAWPLLRQFGFSATVFLISSLIGKTNAWDNPGTAAEPLLAASEITTMRDAGIQFESHSHTHPALTTLAPERVLADLRTSRAELERLLGLPVSVLCYPYGKQNATVRALARDAGFQAGVIARRRMNSVRTDPFRLTRISIDYRMTISRLRWTLMRLRWLHYV